MSEKNSLDLVNVIGEYTRGNSIGVRDVIFACEIVKASILKGIVEVLVEK